MKKFLLLMTAAVVAMSLWAAPVDQATAQKKAQSFLKNQLYAGRLMAPAALNPVLLKAEMGDVKLNQPVYYIYNTSTTFLVVAGDDRAEEILMVGDAPLSDVNNLPLGMQDLLSQYKNEIMFLQEHPGLKVEPIPSPQNSSMLRATTIGPLLSCNWDQSEPYYNQCVFTYSGHDYQCLTGCPATSASMVMYFWKYPTTATPTVPSYRMTLNETYTMTVSALPSTTFDWQNMKNSYSGSYNDANANAVATLMRYVGQAEKMDYGTDGSGISIDEGQDIVTMFKLFGYDSNTTRLVLKNSLVTGATNYSDAQWAAMIQEEMAAGRPIVYMAVSNNSGGHAFNVDGYRDSDNKYHINFGWSGSGNSWCSLNSFGYSSGWYSYNYNQYQQMVIGIQPENTEPTITVDPTSLEFSGYTGTTYTKTFTATGRNLTGNVTISVSGSGFTVSPTSLTPAEIVSGATFTVTYNPTEAGTHEGTVTLSSNGAQTKTVALTGTAIDPPRLTITPTVLTFNTSVGGSQAKTFNVKGSDLTNIVNLSVSGEGYTIDKTAIGKTTAMSTYGSTVKVTFTPTTPGNHPGVITITSAGADTAYVTLNGNATDNNPSIIVNPATLAFNAATGESVTQTFTVTGANLTGNLSVALNDDNGVYSVNKTSITTTQANNGAVVTVTYSPTVFGSHDATITVSGGGANSATVTLNGQASITKFTPVMQPVNNDLVNLTSFRADWTDETYAANVASYTLEVSPKAVEPAEPVLLGSLLGSSYPDNNYADLTLSAPWEAVSVRGGRNAIYIKNNYNDVAQGYITYTIPEGYTNATFTVVVSSINNNYGVGDVTVSTPQTPAVSHNFVKNETFYWLVTASSGEKITMITTDENYSPDMSLIAIYSGDATANAVTLRAIETGDENGRLITDIFDKFYTVQGLTAEGTFLYRVKALYLDGTESDWSNIEEVTLFANEHPYQSGDVNHDGSVDIDDVTTLINCVLGNANNACPVCANITGDDGSIDIDDVTALINKVLGNN